MVETAKVEEHGEDERDKNLKRARDEHEQTKRRRHDKCKEQKRRRLENKLGQDTKKDMEQAWKSIGKDKRVRAESRQ